MKGHSNFLPYFGVIQDVLGLLEIGQNVVPGLTQTHPSCNGNSIVAFSIHAES